MVLISQTESLYNIYIYISNICICNIIRSKKLSLKRHYQHAICSALILVKEGEYPELRIKAYAGRVLVSYLQHKIAILVQDLKSRDAVDDGVLLVHGVLTSICQWYLLVESAQRYLSQSEADAIWNESLKFLAVFFFEK